VYLADYSPPHKHTTGPQADNYSLEHGFKLCKPSAVIVVQVRLDVVLDKLRSAIGMHGKRYKHRILSGNHKIYRASNPVGGSSEAGFNPPEKTPDSMEAQVARVMQQQGYEAGEKDPSWANFTFLEEHAVNYAINRKEPEIFLIRVSKSKVLRNHPYNLDAGIKKEDLYLESLEPREIYALVVPPRYEEETEKALAENGFRGLAKRTTAPPELPDDIDSRKKVLSKFLSEL
jgi:hypothetical protein